MGVLALIGLAYIVTRWAFGGGSSKWSREYANLCREQNKGRISVDEFIRKSNTLWDKYH